MRAFSSKNIAITGFTALTLFVSFVTLSAEPSDSDPMILAPLTQAQDSTIKKDAPQGLGVKTDTDRSLSALECEFLRPAQRFSCIVNGPYRHSIETAGTSLRPKK